MAQNLNLYDVRFEPPVVRLKAHHVALGMLATCGVMVASAQGLQWHARSLSAQADALEAQTRTQATLLATAAAAAPGASGAASNPGTPASADAAEMAQLRATDAAQRRMLATLEAGVVGVREGPSTHLAALARQANDQVWITGFARSEDGRDLELRGRMLRAAALPDYLRRLNDEPPLRGQPFAQLHLQQSGEALAAPGTKEPLRAVDFTLRSTAGAAAKAGR